ncbi:hypothetical protein AAC391_02905, partial [Trueperella pyogenes]|nr:hypothetical protein [Trueperella pyogenes]
TSEQFGAAQKSLEQAKAEHAEAALKLDAARHAADDAGRELADLDKAVGAARKDLDAKRVAYEVASGLPECAPIVPPMPQPEAPKPAPEVAKPEVVKPAPDKAPVVAQADAPKKAALAHTGASTDGMMTASILALLGGAGLFGASRYTARHRRSA